MKNSSENDKRRLRNRAKSTEGLLHDELVECSVCGAVLRQITNTHLRLHSLTPKQYQDVYPELACMSATTMAIRKDMRQHLDCEFISAKATQTKKERRAKLYPSRFTTREEQVVIGTLLGDGEIHHHSKQGGNVNDYLEVYHGPVQRNYLAWKIKELKRFGAKEHEWTRFWEEYGRPYTRLWLTVASHPLFTQLRRDFYPVGSRKVLPIKYLERINKLGLAVWFMDDGSRNGNTLKLCTQAYTYEENEKICAWFKQRWHIECDVLSSGKKEQYLIRFNRAETGKLEKLLQPYILPMFEYKFGKKAPTVLVTKQIQLDAAHWLHDYFGKCFICHGHLYKIDVTIKSNVDQGTGMAQDFGEINDILKESIVQRFDHKVLNYMHPDLRYNSTAENISIVIWKLLKWKLPGIQEVKVYETPTSWATYRGP